MFETNREHKIQIRDYTEGGVYIDRIFHTWVAAFKVLKFEDGTPFGIEVAS